MGKFIRSSLFTVVSMIMHDLLFVLLHLAASLFAGGKFAVQQAASRTKERGLFNYT